jgi:TetR/AcrR family fatty acid metabolism transcriptional regulator
MRDEAQQDRLVQARRRQILDAAARVFSENGFHPATIRDVAREAGIADGTIYNYFENKTALLLGIFDEMITAVSDTVDPSALIGADLRAFLVTYLRHPLNALKADNFALFRVVMAEIMVNAELRAQFMERLLLPTLALGEAALGAMAPGGDIQLRVRALSALLLGLIVTRILDDDVLSARWDELPEAMADLILDGIAR